MFISVAYAQAAEGAAQTPSMFESLLPMLAFFAIIYFFIFRPQIKKQKAHQDLVSKVQRGDEVVTSGGIVGKIDGLNDNFVTLEIASNTKIKVSRGHIASKLQG
ncbi:MAG: preprotein translocase subunit YajC [Bdellovibrionales bacterium]